MSHFDADQLWRKQIERRLFELGAAVRGNLPVQADRIADVVEQIAELRNALDNIAEVQRRMNRTLARIDQLDVKVGELTERLDRHAEFLTVLKRERENGIDGT